MKTTVFHILHIQQSGQKKKKQVNKLDIVTLKKMPSQSQVDI